jgi:hypothetical protein
MTKKSPLKRELRNTNLIVHKIYAIIKNATIPSEMKAETTRWVQGTISPTTEKPEAWAQNIRSVI